jgi:hypothetical protein
MGQCGILSLQELDHIFHGVDIVFLEGNDAGGVI